MYKKILILLLPIGLLLSISKIAFAEESVEQNNLPMGYYIKNDFKNSNANTSLKSTVPANLFSNDTSLPRKDVVDIASYQSWMNQADFNSLKSSGVKSIVIKLTEGTNYANPYAANQIKMAQRAGLNVATYHYARLTGANSQMVGNDLAKREATFFANVALKLNLPKNIVMIMDCEQPHKDKFGKIIGPNPYTVDWASAAASFANQLKSRGYTKTIFYTSASWIGTNTATCQMNYNTLGGRKKLWAAQYLWGKPSAKALKNTQYGAWQYTSQMYFQGTANLKNHAVDTSIDYNNTFEFDTPIPIPPAGSQNVYRLYNGNTGEHFYTLNYAEKTNLQNVGWHYEGVGWFSSTSGSPVYRVYNPNAIGGDHYYTLSKWEAQQLVNKGWKWDNNGTPAFYSKGPKNLYVAYNPNAISGSHNYTTNSYEQNNLLKNGWIYSAIAWKVN